MIDRFPPEITRWDLHGRFRITVARYRLVSGRFKGYPEIIPCRVFRKSDIYPEKYKSFWWIVSFSPTLVEYDSVGMLLAGRWTDMGLAKKVVAAKAVSGRRDDKKEEEKKKEKK
jgi:hypothetical protein